GDHRPLGGSRLRRVLGRDGSPLQHPPHLRGVVLVVLRRPEHLAAARVDPHVVPAVPAPEHFDLPVPVVQFGGHGRTRRVLQRGSDGVGGAHPPRRTRLDTVAVTTPVVPVVVTPIVRPPVIAPRPRHRRR